MVHKQIISVNGTELEFLNTVYDWFLSIDGITMNPTKANLETAFNAISGTSDYFIFTVTFRNITYCFTRRNTGLDDTNGYYLTVDNTSLSPSSNKFALSYSSTSKAPDTIAQRQWSFTLINSSISWKFIPETYNSGKAYYLFIPTSDGILYVPSTSSTTTLANTSLSVVGENDVYKIAPMLSYDAGEDNIDYLRFSVLCDNSLQKVAVLDNLNQCSTVLIDQIFTIDGDNYYSIATDCIIKI